MLGMKENLIDMLGTVFANRQTEASARARMVPGYVEEEKKIIEAFNKLCKFDKEAVLALEAASNYLSTIEAAEAYYLGLQDGFTWVQLLTQNEYPFLALEGEAVNKVEATIPQNNPFLLRPYALRSTPEKKEAS